MPMAEGRLKWAEAKEQVVWFDRGDAKHLVRLSSHMKVNADTVLVGGKAVLVPYLPEHVPVRSATSKLPLSNPWIVLIN
jgi:hypothetical protein